MSVLTIQAPAERGRSPRRVDLRAGEVATFGSCGCGVCELDLRVPAAPAPFRGEVLAAADRWRVANAGDGEPFRVTDLDTGRTVLVWPGEQVPFRCDMATVSPGPGGTDGPAGMVVFFSPDTAPRPARGRPCPAIRPRRGPRLDPDARYFAVLEVLCEPVLDGAGARGVPTSGDIAGRLGISPRAVDAHVDYLVDKLAIPTPPIRGTGWKRRALVAHVRRWPDTVEGPRAGAHQQGTS